MNTQKNSQYTKSFDEMTPSEVKIAEFLDHNRHMNAFETISSISQRVGVSKATVVRFIFHLGYKSFPEFKKEIRKEISYKLESPLKRYMRKKNQLMTNRGDILGQYFSQIMHALEETYARVDSKIIEEVARLIIESKGTLYIMGQLRSYGLAYTLWTWLKTFRDRVNLLDDHTSLVPEQLIDVTANDLLIAITHRRYSKQTFLVAKYFAAQGTKIILITDKKFTPVSDLANLQLVAYSSGPSIFDSLCSTMAILETLIFAIVSINKTGIFERLKVADRLFKDFETFCTDDIRFTIEKEKSLRKQLTRFK